MKKMAASMLSVLLAAALVLVSAPRAQAAPELSLWGSGAIKQVLAPQGIDVAETGLLLATVWDKGGTEEWGTCWPTPSVRDVFQLPEDVYLQPGSVFGKPGSSGTYTFTLRNEYAAPIRYWLSVSNFIGPDAANMDPAVDGEPLAWTLTGDPVQGELPVGGSAAFTLTWFWNGKPVPGDGKTEEEVNVFDTDYGIQSKLDNRTLYKVLMEFYIEADELDNCPWWLLIPPLLALPLLGLPLLGLPLLGLPLLALPFLGRTTEVSPSPPDEDDDPPFEEEPLPVTGDSETMLLWALLALGFSGAGAALLPRKKREAAS